MRIYSDIFVLHRSMNRFTWPVFYFALSAILAVFIQQPVCAQSVPSAAQNILQKNDDKIPVKIGVLAFRGKSEAIKRWSEMASYLGQQIPQYGFIIIPLNLSEMAESIADNRIDFALTNPGNYVTLEQGYGISRIATLQTLRQGKLSTRFGSIIFSRADNKQINRLQDLKGKRFMAVSPDAFGGFQLAWRELAEKGIDPFNDFSELIFAGFPQDNILYAVRDGKADAGTVRADILLRLIDEGKIRYRDFRILNPKHNTHYPYPLSTRLYPEWPFSRLKNTSYELSKQVAMALYAMPEDHPAARTSHTAGWTIPLDYSAVYELMKTLKIGPYEVLRQVTLSALVKKYAYWLLLAVIFLTSLIIYNFYASLTNRKLRKIDTQLRDEIIQSKEQHQIEMARVCRLTAMGEMAASLAHELNQPLTGAINYSSGCLNMLREEQLNKQKLKIGLQRTIEGATLAADIIRQLHEFVQKGESRRKPMAINQAVYNVLELIKPELQRCNIKLQLNLMDCQKKILANRVQIEQVVLNFIRNALDAIVESERQPGNITIATSCAEKQVILSVADTGNGIEETKLNSIFDAFYSSKPEGMGMGLSISRTIIESHNGHIRVENLASGGCRFTIELPLIEY